MLDKVKPFPVVIVAPSGTGKTTICRELLKEMPNFRYSVSATTREPRQGEVDGKDYYFLKKEEFGQWIRDGKFCEYASVYGELYGTPKDRLEKYLGDGFHVLLALDPQGAQAIKQVYPGAISIFVLPPSMDELAERLTLRSHLNRGAPDINNRLNTAEEEISKIKEFDYFVVNDSLSACVEKIKSIIIAEESRTHRLYYERVSEKLCKI